MTGSFARAKCISLSAVHPAKGSVPAAPSMSTTDGKTTAPASAEHPLNALLLIDSIAGDYYAVVGLPVAQVNRELQKLL